MHYNKGLASLMGTIIAGGLPTLALADPGFVSLSQTESGASESVPLANQLAVIHAEGGAVSFMDLQGSGASRAAAGIGLDFNLAWWAPPASLIYSIELSTGAIFSHLGSTSSNFLGRSPQALITNPGSNLLLLPLDLKAGWKIGKNVKISAHGGGSVVYRSASSSIDLGASSDTSGASWAVFPDAGADLELGIGDRLSILLRPDLTFTPGTSVLTWLLGFGIGLG